MGCCNSLLDVELCATVLLDRATNVYTSLGVGSDSKTIIIAVTPPGRTLFGTRTGGIGGTVEENVLETVIVCGGEFVISCNVAEGVIEGDTDALIESVEDGSIETDDEGTGDGVMST